MEKLFFEIDGETVELEMDDVLVETAQSEQYVAESYGDVTVVVDTKLTPELIEEGFVREIISKVQTMRKEAGFEVLDHIKIYYSGNEKIAGVIERNKDSVMADVLAKDAIEGKGSGYSKEWNINGEKVTLEVEKI